MNKGMRKKGKREGGERLEKRGNGKTGVRGEKRPTYISF